MLLCLVWTCVLASRKLTWNDELYTCYIGEPHVFMALAHYAPPL